MFRVFRSARNPLSWPFAGVRPQNRQNRHDPPGAPIILGELRYGILRLPSGRKRARLLEWFEAGAAQLRVLDLDAETARVWAALLAELRRKGRAMPLKDSLIAAPAQQHNLIVATRNTADFAPTGIRLVDPFRA